MPKKRKPEENQPTLSEWIARKPNTRRAADDSKQHFRIYLTIALCENEYSFNWMLLSISFPLLETESENEVEIEVMNASASTSTAAIPKHPIESDGASTSTVIDATDIFDINIDKNIGS